MMTTMRSLMAFVIKSGIDSYFTPPGGSQRVNRKAIGLHLANGADADGWGRITSLQHRTATLFDDLVGAQHDRRGYGKAERRGGLAVYDHLELGRKLHREIAGLLAAQNAIDIGGGTTKRVYPVGSVVKQTALSDKLRLRINRGDVVPRRRHYNRRAMREHECIRHGDKPASRLAPKRDDGGFDF